jgi:hypothetical protein
MSSPGNRIKRWGLGPAFFFGLFVFSPGVWGSYEIFGRTTVSAVSEPEPVKTTLDDWGSEFEDGERQWALGLVEIGFRIDSGVEVSVFSRALADLRMNRAAVAFYGRIARKESLQAGETVPVSIEANGFSGHGLRLGYLHETGGWTLGGGLSLFRTDHLLAGTLEGLFTAISDTDYDFNAQVDYQYFRDPIFERPDIRKADGLGWGLDFALDWQPGDQWRITARVEDLLARIRWEDAPYTEAVASTDQKSFDENGYAEFAPLLSGREGYRDTFMQDLDARYYGAVEYRLKSWLLSAYGQYQFGYGYAGFGVGYRFDDRFTLEARYWPEHEITGVSVRKGQWALDVSLDQLRWRDVQALSLGLSYGY